MTFDRCPLCQKPWPKKNVAIQPDQCGRGRGATGEVRCLKDGINRLTEMIRAGSLPELDMERKAMLSFPAL